jgi:hypothetical protein
LVIWLSVQTLAIGISPSWGFILPHDHVTRGFLSQAAWQAHLREHQLGARVTYAQPCDSWPTTGARVIASIPDSAGEFSFFTIATASLQDALLKIPAPGLPEGTFVAADFYAFDFSYAPLEPPPTA